MTLSKDSMDYHILIISKNDLKIIVAGVVIGGVFQIICSEYLKKHPEILNRPNIEQPEEVKPAIEPKKPRNRFRRLVPRFPRGGAVIEIELIIAIVNHIAEHGWVIGGYASLAMLSLSKVSSKAVSRVLRNALLVNHSNYEKTKYFLPEEHKICLEGCERPLEYMFEILKTKEIPYAERAEKTFKILTTYLNLDTRIGRIRFVLCVVSILCILFDAKDLASFHLLMQKLLEAIKSGKISKRLGRLIVRRLLRKGVMVAPDLIDAVGA